MRTCPFPLPPAPDPPGHVTPSQLECARAARRLHSILCHPSDPVLTTLLDNGGILDCNVTSACVRLATRIFGPCVHCLQAKQTDHLNQAGQHNSESLTPPAENIGDHLIADIIYIKGGREKKIPALLIIEELTNAASILRLSSKRLSDVKSGLFKAIGYYRSHGHHVHQIRTDHEVIFTACRPFLNNMLPPVQLSQAAPGVHARRVERYVRTLRERMRACASALPFSLPSVLWLHLAYSVVSMMNQVPNSQSGTRAPFELITRWKPSLKGSLKHPFGAEVIVFRPNLPDVDKESMRGERALYLYPNKGANSCTVYLLDRGIVAVRASNPSKLHEVKHTADAVGQLTDPEDSTDLTHDPIVERMPRTITANPTPSTEQVEEPAVVRSDENILEETTDIDDLLDQDEDIVEEMDPPTRDDAAPADHNHDLPPLDALYEPVADGRFTNPMRDEVHVPIPTEPLLLPHTTPAQPTASQIALPERQLVPLPAETPGRPSRNIPRVDYRNPPKHSTSSIVDLAFIEAELVAHLTKLDPLNCQAIVRDSVYCANISVSKGMKTMPQRAEPAILDELDNLMDKSALRPIQWDTLSHESKKRAIHGYMFLKEKFKADGTFDKLKARLVAGEKSGRFDGSDPLTDPSSPTVDFLTVCLILNLICNDGLKVAVADVKGAYLNAPIDEEVYLVMDPITAEIFVRSRPQYKSMLRQDGRLACLINRALYGLAQSGALWYTHIKATLELDDYTCIKFHDRCLFHKRRGTERSYILLYVDDLLIAGSTDKIIEDTLRHLENTYQTLTIQRGTKFSYLGMTLTFTDDRKSVTLSQKGYVDELLRDYAVQTGAKSPYRDDFIQQPTGDRAKPIPVTLFRQKLMRLAYLTIRTRFDLRFLVGHLSTRVNAPTIHDMDCLDRALRYVFETRSYCVRFCPHSNAITASIDASFCSHNDGMGHTGIIIQMGNGGPLYVQSSKQKLRGMSSTECEIIAVNDFLFTLHRIKALYEALDIPFQAPVTVEQDNESAIAIMNAGRGNSNRNKYMLIRVENIHDCLSNNLIRLVSTRTADVCADILTKPMSGSLLRKFTRILLNLA